jgi:hypothetical protein
VKLGRIWWASHGGDKKCLQNFVRKLNGKWLLGNQIKMDLREIGCGSGSELCPILGLILAVLKPSDSVTTESVDTSVVR